MGHINAVKDKKPERGHVGFFTRLSAHTPLGMPTNVT